MAVSCKWGDFHHNWLKDSCLLGDKTRSGLDGISGYDIICGKMMVVKNGMVYKSNFYYQELAIP